MRLWQCEWHWCSRPLPLAEVAVKRAISTLKTLYNRSISFYEYVSVSLCAAEMAHLWNKIVIDLKEVKYAGEWTKWKWNVKWRGWKGWRGYDDGAVCFSDVLRVKHTSTQGGLSGWYKSLYGDVLRFRFILYFYKKKKITLEFY